MNFTEESRGIQASQLIQARCSEITSLAQMHPLQKDSAERDADHSWPDTWPPHWGKWSPPTTQYYVNILRLNYNMQYLVEEGEAL